MHDGYTLLAKFGATGKNARKHQDQPQTVMSPSTYITFPHRQNNKEQKTPRNNPKTIAT